MLERGMRLRVFTEPQQGATYDQLLDAAIAAEEAGFDAFFRSDHYLPMGSSNGRPGPTDAWITLAGLARDTTSLRLGTLVNSATFRLPGPLAVIVAQVDAMSAGRVELGLGAGWYTAEHEAFGIPFPALKDRFDMLEEQLSIITGLWGAADGGPFNFDGQRYSLSGNPALVRPAQRPRPPIIIGGHGRRRTPALAARFADEFNVAFSPPSECRELFETVDAACEAAGRDPQTLRHSAAVVVCCGTDATELSRRAAAMGRDLGELRTSGVAGTPAEVVERLSEWAEAGAATVYLQFLDLTDLEHIALVGREVIPALR